MLTLVKEWWFPCLISLLGSYMLVTSENPLGLGRWFPSIRRRYWRRVHRLGKPLSSFIARDVRREIEVVDVSRIREGIITARVRTTNVLYVSGGLMKQPEFEPACEYHIDDIWRWTGKPWGGLADGTSVLQGTFRRPQE